MPWKIGLVGASTFGALKWSRYRRLSCQRRAGRTVACGKTPRAQRRRTMVPVAPLISMAEMEAS